MRALELFAGTHSISRALEEKGWSVDSLDVEPCFNPTFLTDIRNFDFESICPGTYDYIHASCPCTEYSRAKTTGVRDLETADALVNRTLECIRHLSPKFWSIENPATGMLKERPCMRDVPVVCVLEYCRYGTPYKKSTIFFGKMPDSFVGKRCNKDCAAFDGRRHAATAQRAEFPRHVLYAIPPRLCEDIARCLTDALLQT
jgi:hypothetical protein